MQNWSKEEMAQRIAARLRAGEVVNLGIGMPTLVARFTPEESGIIFHSENGIIGMGGAPSAGIEDPDLIDAGKAPVTLIAGAAIVGHDESFGLIRGGHLDTAVLGGYLVSADGDLANWLLPGKSIGSVGGAMDIAVGAKRIIVMMKHVDPNGQPKLVRECTYPLTARGVVSLVVTDLAIVEIAGGVGHVRELAPGVTPAALRDVTEMTLRFSLP
jgi:3-oxoacid CoA-transferase B subunit